MNISEIKQQPKPVEVNNCIYLSPKCIDTLLGNEKSEYFTENDLYSYYSNTLQHKKIRVILDLTEFTIGHLDNFTPLMDIAKLCQKNKTFLPICIFLEDSRDYETAIQKGMNRVIFKIVSSAEEAFDFAETDTELLFMNNKIIPEPWDGKI